MGIQVQGVVGLECQICTWCNLSDGSLKDGTGPELTWLPWSWWRMNLVKHTVRNRVDPRKLAQDILTGR